MSDLFLGAPQQEHHEAPPPSRRSRRDTHEQKARRRKHKRRRTFVVLLLALALVGGAVFVMWSVVGGLFSGDGGTEAGVEDYPGPGSGEVQVTVAAGDTGGAIGATLAEANVVATAGAFTSAYAANPAATGIQPGTYNLLQEMRASDAVNALLDPANRASSRVTIPEGYTASQIYERLYEVTTIPVEDFEAAAGDAAGIGLPAVAGGNVEGWLFPATYEVEPGATATSVLAQMVGRTTALLTEKGVPQDQWETVLNKASIVEREGKLDEDRAKIARAIENRLAMPMNLQIDAINAYGLGIPGTQLTNADTGNAQPPYNPYNSYKIPGLPPTPIASPGEVSIDAVLNPADGPWLYWVTVNLDTGETKFAETFPEHQENVDELRAWQAANQ